MGADERESGTVCVCGLRYRFFFEFRPAHRCSFPFLRVESRRLANIDASSRAHLHEKKNRARRECDDCRPSRIAISHDHRKKRPRGCVDHYKQKARGGFDELQPSLPMNVMVWDVCMMPFDRVSISASYTSSTIRPTTYNPPFCDVPSIVLTCSPG